MKRQLLEAISLLSQNSNLITLSNGKQFEFAKTGRCCQVLETTRVMLNHSLIEFQATFRSRSLHISDKLRQAVLDPLKPVTYGGVMQNSDGDENATLNSLAELV